MNMMIKLLQQDRSQKTGAGIQNAPVQLYVDSRIPFTNGYWGVPLTGRIWKIKAKSQSFSAEDQAALGISPFLAELLCRRGINNRDSARKFLDGGLGDLYAPNLMPDSDRAAERLVRAIKDRERILVYGDYDVDGITSTALVVRTLRAANANVVYFIPRRFEEGYGLNRSVLEKAVKNSCTVVLTVDCGISGIDEAQYLAEQGVDLIITDHHEPSDVLPAAYSIVNPKLAGTGYPWPHLAGVGVAYKLLQSLAVHLPIIQRTLEDNLDLVALGTVADVVPLLDENRIFVKEGLALMARTTNIGLQALLDKVRLKPPYTAEQVAFILAPRINATGRLNEPSLALSLFLTSDPEQAQEHAEALERANRERQSIEEKLLKEALVAVERTYDPERHRVIVLAGEGWHHGVIGIVAARILERYHRPTVLIGIEDGIGKGSARSIAGFHLFKAFQDCDELLTRYGGHEMAAGLTIPADQIDAFRERLNHLAMELDPQVFRPSLHVEERVELSLVTLDLAREFQRLAPFGMSNPAPVLICKGLNVLQSKAVGENAKHLKVRLGDGKLSRDGIGFNFGSFLEEALQAGCVDVAFCVGENTWNAVTDVQLVIKDIQVNAIMEEETA